MDRSVPFDLPAERAVLGACLLDRDAITAERNLVAIADFYLEQHALIYEAILDCLADKVAPDLVTVCSHLRRRDYLDQVGGISFVSELLDKTPTAVHADHYARIVNRTARARRIIQFGGELAAMAYDASVDPDKLIDEAEQRLQLERKAVSLGDDWHSKMIDGADIWRKAHTPRPFVVEEVLPVGITLLHALPKKRKSWLAKDFCYAVAGGGKAMGQLQAQQGEALYINLEMDEELLNERLKIMFPSGAPHQGVKFFQEWPNLDSGFFTQLESYLTARPYTRIVVLDTLVRVFPDDAYVREGYRVDARLIENFTKFNANRGLAVLLIHHSRKASGGNDPVLGASGSTGLTGSVDGVLELLVDGDDGSKGKLLRSGRRFKNDTPLPLRWDVQLGRWAINTSAGKLTPERRQIVDLLQEHGPLMPKGLAALLDRPAHSVRRLLGEMVQAGQVVSMQGIYDVPGDETMFA